MMRKSNMSNENIEIDPYLLVEGDEFIHHDVTNIKYQAKFIRKFFQEQLNLWWYEFVYREINSVLPFTIKWHTSNMENMLRTKILEPVNVFQLNKQVDFINDPEYEEMLI